MILADYVIFMTNDETNVGRIITSERMQANLAKVNQQLLSFIEAKDFFKSNDTVHRRVHIHSDVINYISTGSKKFDFVPTPRKIHHSKELEKLNKII